MRTTVFLLLFLTACDHTAKATAPVAAAAATDAAADSAAPPDASSAVALPAACGVAAAQACNPFDGHGCDAGKTCDLAADGTWQCLPGGDAAEGAPCDGLQGPFCGDGLSCVGTTTGKATCARLCCGDGDCAGAKCSALHAMGDSAGKVGVCGANPPATVVLGNQPALVEGRGHIVTWTSWRKALALQMAWYANTCPDVGGYPLLASATHWGGDCKPDPTTEVIAALQCGTGILSNLAYDAFAEHDNPLWLQHARRLGDYLLKEAVTPSDGLWPGVFRSTGEAMVFPQPPDCGMKADPPYETEPDKLGLAGIALLQLADVTGEQKYADAALHQAVVLAANITEANATTSPWPFRVDWRDGSSWEPISGNMVYNLRLFDVLIAKGHTELQPTHDKLWTWMRDVQIPNAAGDGTLWAEFFEDWFIQTNRNAWAPLSTASYLMERREALDPDWKKHADILLTFVEKNFIDVKQGWPVCIEQDMDRKPFGGILSTYAAAEARWAQLTGDSERRGRAYTVTALLIQSVGSDGCPADRALNTGCGGWQEDAHTDRVHNLLAVLAAFPQWAD